MFIYFYFTRVLMVEVRQYDVLLVRTYNFIDFCSTFNRSECSLNLVYYEELIRFGMVWIIEVIALM